MDKQKASNKKIIGIVIAIIIIALIGFGIFNLTIAPKKNREKADSLISQGKYVDADNTLSRIAQTDEIKELRQNLFYESRVAHCAALVKNNLLDPESLRLLDVIMGENIGFTKDESLSSETKEVSYPVQPDVLLYFSARTRGGGTTDAYCLFDGETDSYKQSPIITSLSYDDTPSDLSPSEAVEYTVARAIINYWLVSRDGKTLKKSELSRVNNLMSNSEIYEVPFIPYNSVIPKPTNQIIEVTPKP